MFPPLAYHLLKSKKKSYCSYGTDKLMIFDIEKEYSDHVNTAWEKIAKISADIFREGSEKAEIEAAYQDMSEGTLAFLTEKLAEIEK